MSAPVNLDSSDFAPTDKTTLDLLAREERFTCIRKHLVDYRGRGRPIADRFLRLLHQAYVGGLAKMTGALGYPKFMESLRRRFEAGDRAALGAALAEVDGDAPITDPAAIEEEWIRRGILAVAREHLPQKGSGGITSKTHDELRRDNRVAVAVSRALPRLVKRYDDAIRAGWSPGDARKQAEEGLRVTEPARRKRILHKFRRWLRTHRS